MRLRVLHIVPLAPDGGTSVFVRRQIDRLSEAGVEGRSVLFGGAAMFLRPHQLPRRIVAIRREIRAFQPDIVHAHWGSLLGLASAIAATGGPPLVITYRGSDINPVPSEARIRSMIRVACSQLAALRASEIICVSEELRARLWSRRRPVKVVPDGTDLSLFRPIDKLEARRRLKWPLNRTVVFFYEGGRPDVKRRDLANSSLGEIRKSLADCRLEVMGLDVPRECVPLLLCAADCLLVTSDFEGSPNIVREALACNTPIVSVDVGDVRRWLTGVDGTKIVLRDPVEIGKVVVELIRAGIRPSIGCKASQFSEESSANAVLGVYRQVLDSRKINSEYNK